LWSDYAEEYQAWSKRLDINRIGILGGEPLLNPDFETWVKELANLWPNSHIIIITNGTQFSRWPNLYSLLAQYQGRIFIDIHRHNPTDTTATLETVEQLYPSGFKKYYIEDRYYTQHPNHDIHYGFEEYNVGKHIWQDPTYSIVYSDSNNIRIRYSESAVFDNILLTFDPETKSISLPYNSDPDRAIDVCSSKWSHHMVRGKLYKCAVTAVLPEFVQQFIVNMSDDQHKLLNSYRAAEHTWSDRELEVFVQDLVSCASIEQCSLCPEQFYSKSFVAGNKKILIKKI
jgi:hypothetical protein